MTAAVAAALVLAGCGTTTASPVAAPSTAATTTSPPSPTVPPLAGPPAPLPATAANAPANATGACAAFSTFYLRIAQAPVAAGDAAVPVGRVAQFAHAASSGAPGQWAQLARDVDALDSVLATPAWASAAHQDQLPSVVAVFDDCRPLQ